MKKVIQFILSTFKCWKKDDALSEGAALSFYTIVAFPALLLSLIFIASIFLEKETIQTEVLRQTQLVVGEKGKIFVEQILKNVPPRNELRIGSVLSIIILLISASGFFGQLQTALNKVWNVTPKKSLEWNGFFKNKAMMLVMVLGLGGLLIGTMIIEFLLSFFLPYFQSILPVSVDLIQNIGYVIAFIIMIFAFALVYKYLPHAHIAWRDVWVGSTVTAVLFTLGKFFIGFYLSNSSVGTAYGAAGSLIVFLLWIYYSSQAIFLGAEFTQNYANTYGSKIKPKKNALRTDSLWNKIIHKV